MVGVTDKQLIRSNDRFHTYQARLDGRPVFVKTAASEKMQPAIKSEAEGLKAMRAIDPEDQHYHVPKVIDVADDTIVTSWAEGSPMINDFSHQHRAEHIKTLLQLYALMDDNPNSQIGMTRYNRPERKNGIDSAADEIQSFTELHISADLVKAVANFAHEQLPTIQTKFTHGDLQPGNILISAGEKPTIIDCESCSELWPQHYNIVNFVVNYSANQDPAMQPELVQALNSYLNLRELEVSEVRDQLNFSAAMRCLQIIVELRGKLPRQTQNYLERAMTNITDGKLFCA